ncbi:Pyrrolo-quinoline quinone [Thozetella sp. PMI_491]|nr:Pyrrolo-quinoline quinone [Thozetella sp. PMI_491]
MTAVASLLLSFAVRPALSLGATDTITWGGDNSRAGYETSHNMDPAIVASDQFQQIFVTKLPGNYGNQQEQVYSQPLVYTTPSDGVQYLFVSTTQNNVYKIDAKTGNIVASRNLHIPFLQADLDNCFDISPHIGIISTGVIDPATDTLYLTSKTYADQTQTNKAKGRPNGRWYIHALDVNTLQEKPNFPINLEGTVARNSAVRAFNGGIQHQRPALLMHGNYIYVGFGSHCVQYTYTGWVIGFHKTTAQIVERFATQGQGVDASLRGASLWMSGGGIASDDKGSIFFACGNGYANQLGDTPVKGRTPPTSLEEGAVHMTINDDGSLNLVDFFMPYEKRDLDNADLDLGTSPLAMLPNQFSCGNVTRVGVVTGKSGKTYWLNLDNMGGYKNGAGGYDDVLQVFQNNNVVYAGVGVYPLEGGYIYVNVIGYPTNVFKFSCDAGVPSWTKVAESPDSNVNALGVGHGSVTTLNNQPGTGLLWTSDTQKNTLKIYNAVPQNGTLKMIKSFSVVGVTKFTRPVFGDGIVYQGTRFGLLYAYGAPTKSPLDCGNTTNAFGTGELGAASATKTITCKALVDVTVNTIALDDASNFVLSGLPATPSLITAGSTMSFNVAFKPSQVGGLFANVLVQTNNITSYTSKSAIRLSGTGQSSKPMLSITPGTIAFKTMAVGSGTNSQSIVLANGGLADLTITSFKYSWTGSSGPFVTETSPFKLSNVPSRVAANSQVVVTIDFTPTVANNYTLTVLIDTPIGQQTVTITASSGAAPVAKLEFQTPDGTGWVTYDSTKNLTFGTVLQGQTRTLKFRVSNIATAGGVPLEIGVSKPPLATDGNILGAANLVDLAEGTSIASGQSATANLYCSPPTSFWNTDPYSRSVVWTMNTNGLNFGKQFITFECTAAAPQAAPLLASGQGKFRFAGCYKEYNPGRVLDKLIYSDTANMTTANCIAACDKAGYNLCGLQYRQECWGGKTLPTIQVDDADCDYVCTGDNTQSCGGNGAGPGATGTYITLFAYNASSTQAASTPSVVVNPGYLGYDSIGCWSEATTGRALPNQVATTAKNVASCINACAGKYEYIGLEYYGNECWCGTNLLAAGVAQLDISKCSRVCIDNSTEYCGGPKALNVYRAASYKPVSNLQPTVNSTSNWEVQGCYSDSSTARTLGDKQIMADTVTLDSCAAFCDGYRYFGTEYGRECYCGSTLANTTTKSWNPSECNMSCKGNATQTCGAASRIQVYANPALSV